MNRERVLQWVKKESRIPRDALKISLAIAIALNIVSAWYAFQFWARAGELRNEARTNGFKAGMHFALRDITSGRPRLLKIEVVEVGARAANEFENTNEVENGLQVCIWRVVHFGSTSLFADNFAHGYNITIEGWRIGEERQNGSNI